MRAGRWGGVRQIGEAHGFSLASGAAGIVALAAAATDFRFSNATKDLISRYTGAVEKLQIALRTQRPPAPASLALHCWVCRAANTAPIQSINGLPLP
jgi:hypothetical protein